MIAIWKEKIDDWCDGFVFLCNTCKPHDVYMFVYVKPELRHLVRIHPLQKSRLQRRELHRSIRPGMAFTRFSQQITCSWQVSVMAPV